MRGVSRLALDAVAGVIDIVESMHRNISGLAPIVGASHEGRTTGITGVVYTSVRGVSRLVGATLDTALAQLAALLTSSRSSPRREAVLAALNGVLGDHLVATDNPLAIAMRLRKNGSALQVQREALAKAFPRPAARLVVLVHGLCMNDLQWRRNRHDHGAALARDLAYTPLYLHYNTGVHISSNGRQFADLLEQAIGEWPVPVDELVIIGHSMGGLLARSACYYGSRARHKWPRVLKKLIFLGTPHHGAPLERAGNWIDILVSISPYTAPFARLGKVRSAGVKDLRYGNVVDADWNNAGSERTHDARKRVPLPRTVECFAIAASVQRKDARAHARIRGDGLVPVKSALGQHDDRALALAIPDTHRAICYELNHLDLLASHDVYDRLHDWMA